MLHKYTLRLVIFVAKTHYFYPKLKDNKLKSIAAQNYYVHFNENAYSAINNSLETNRYSKIFILVDEQTHEYCLPTFMSNIVGEYDFEIIEIESGEIYKNIETATQVWLALSELNADRKSLLINLGGGVVTDLGGFIASTYQRGIHFINVPTTLLSMVDASIGGKTGIDLGVIKNQIGVINTPEMVLIDTSFLQTLPREQMRSGLAEMLKHGLIQDEQYWKKMTHLNQLNEEILDELIYHSVIIKNKVVTQDPTEKNLRKTLNFGHTLGHAIESYFLQSDEKKMLLHGRSYSYRNDLSCLSFFLSYRFSC